MCSPSSLVMTVSATSFVSISTDMIVSSLPLRNIYFSDSLPYRMAWQQWHHVGGVYVCIGSKGFWWWYMIFRFTSILEFVHHPGLIPDDGQCPEPQ
jgi:hypothetical protein